MFFFFCPLLKSVQVVSQGEIYLCLCFSWAYNKDDDDEDDDGGAEKKISQDILKIY